MLKKLFSSNSEKFSMNKLPLNKRVHPGIKFFCFIIMVIFAFMANTFFTLIIFTSFLLLLYGLCKIGKRNFMAILKTMLIMFSIFCLINWIFYKNPVCFSIENFNILGYQSYLQKLDWAQSNGDIYISKIWGGNVLPLGNAITQDMVKYFADPANDMMNHINKWATANGYDESKLTPFLNGSLLSWLDTADKKKVFVYLMNNKFTFEGIKYNVYFVHALGSSDSIVYNPYMSAIYNTNWYTLSPCAIIRAAYISIKITCILLASAMLTETTTSVELSTGLETILSPLKIIKFPVNEAATIIAVAIRFIPSLLSESKRILNAQASRGVDFNNGNIFVKLKALVSLVVPLFSIAFKNSDELANAMDARGYDPKAYRTKYRIFKFSMYDFFLVLLVVFFASFVAAIKFTNVFFVFFGIAEGELAF